MQLEDYSDRHYIGNRKRAETEQVCHYEFICTEFRRIGTKRLERLGHVMGSLGKPTIRCLVDKLYNRAHGPVYLVV